MTEQQYEQAAIIKNQISSINAILSTLTCVDDFKFDPPTRDSSFVLEDLHGNKAWKRLNEGEVECIKLALESKKLALQEEFERL